MFGWIVAAAQLVLVVVLLVRLHKQREDIKSLEIELGYREPEERFTGEDHDADRWLYYDKQLITTCLDMYNAHAMKLPKKGEVIQFRKFAPLIAKEHEANE